MSSSAPVPAVFDTTSSEAPQFYVAAIISYIFATVAVALRLWARKLMKAQVWVDD